jgi:hypothetical protein
VTDHEKLLAARTELVAQIEALPGAVLTMSEDELAAQDAERTRRERVSSSDLRPEGRSPLPSRGQDALTEHPASSASHQQGHLRRICAAT